MNRRPPDGPDPEQAGILGRNRFPDIIPGTQPEDVEAAIDRDFAATGRAYGVVFGRVWVFALAAARAMPRWTVARTDPANGEIYVDVRPLLRRSTRPLAISIGLDDLGLTRVDAGFLSPSGGPMPGHGGRQIERFYRHLEQLVAAEEERRERGEL